MEFLQQNWHWVALAAASGGWLLIENLRAAKDPTQTSPIQATLLINREDAVVIDVREQGSYAQGHIPNAIHLPLADLERRASELEKFKNRPIILYCERGNRSQTAMTTLKKAGFEKLYNLRGGLFEWQKGGHPISRKKK